MTIINSRKEYWPSLGSNQRPPVLKSAVLPTELWGLVESVLDWYKTVGKKKMLVTSISPIYTMFSKVFFHKTDKSADFVQECQHKFTSLSKMYYTCTGITRMMHNYVFMDSHKHMFSRETCCMTEKACIYAYQPQTKQSKVTLLILSQTTNFRLKKLDNFNIDENGRGV